MKWLFLSLIALGLWLQSVGAAIAQPHRPQGNHQPLEVDRVLSVPNPIPRTGDQPLLVVLVDFPDRTGLFTGQAWQQVFFGANGFTDYFKENSYNQLRYTGDIVGLTNGAPAKNSANVAYVRLPNPITYYANGNHGFSMGQNFFPRNDGGVVAHALQALDNAGFNFTPYANPMTKRIENLIVVFAGSSYAYTQDTNNSLEATAYRLVDAGGGEYVTKGGQIADNFTFCPDQRLKLSGQIAYIGVCAHEHGHALGMVELYDFSVTTTGAGAFDLMAYGVYGAGEGLRPFQFGAFSKQLFGWSTATVMNAGTTTVALPPAETNSKVLKLYPHGDATSKEYFLLENRQALGFDQEWSSKLCPGLAIWHVDQTILDAYFAKNLINTLPSAGGPPHQGAIVVEADGRFDMSTPRGALNYGECSDLWQPGQTWGGASSNLWTGAASGLTVQVLSSSNDALNLSITVDNGAGPTPTPTATTKPTTGTPTPPATNTPTPAGTPVFDPNARYRFTTQWQGDGKSLDSTNANGRWQPILAISGNGGGQAWKLTALGNGYYRLTTQSLGDGLSLDILNDGVNTQPIFAATGNYSGQFWQITPLGNGYYRLTTQWRGANWSLDIVNDGVNNKPILAPSANASGQFWKIAAFTAATPTSTPTPTFTATPTRPTPTPTLSPTPSVTPTPINGCFVSLNDGATFTGQRAVTVRALVSGASAMQLSNDGGFTGAVWQAYAPATSWTLRDVGQRIATLVVYVRFRNAAGALLCNGAILTDDIIYDPLSPKVTSATLTAGQLMITAEDQVDGSGVADLEISGQADFADADWQPFTPVVSLPATEDKNLYIRVRDQAGNESAVVNLASSQQWLFLPFVQR
ncbi:MAG: M6 family metalloprotease domain-containing protein [Caldilineaceae bacterium]